MAARAECLSLPRRVSGIVGLGLRLLDAGSAQHGEKSQALWSEGGDPREDRGDATPRNRGDAESPLLTLAREGPGLSSGTRREGPRENMAGPLLSTLQIPGDEGPFLRHPPMSNKSQV